MQLAPQHKSCIYIGSMQSIQKFIAERSAISVDKIYGSTDDDSTNAAWACKAIFSSLSALSKIYVQRLLTIQDSVRLSDLELWVKPEFKRLHSKTVDDLLRLQILVVTDPMGKQGDEDVMDMVAFSSKRPRTAKSTAPQIVSLNKHFRKGLQYALCHPEEPWSTSTAAGQLKIDKKAPSKDFLDSFSAGKWNDILRYLLQLKSPGDDKSIEAFLLSSAGPGLPGLLTRTGALKSGGNTLYSYDITAEGYTFLLKDRQSQVWVNVLQTLMRSAQAEEALSFLFMLAGCEFGKCYPIDALSKSQRQMMFEFYKIGLIYVQDIKTSPQFYPTRLAIDLLFKTTRDDSDGDKGAPSSSSSKGSDEPTSNLQIIVETNFQVTAYLTSDIHLAMVRLFVDVSIIMPNMAMGKITRDRAKEAFERGIRAHQIVDFLKAHAHPETLKKEDKGETIVPSDVSDRLVIWEVELIRIQEEDAIVVDLSTVRGMTPAAFKELRNYAKKMDVCLWASDQKLSLAIVPDGLDLVQAYIQDQFDA